MIDLNWQVQCIEICEVLLELSRQTHIGTFNIFMG